MKLKILTDLEQTDICDSCSFNLKQEAIKWVKEDIEDTYCYAQEILTNKWMKRLNITEEDLK